ncbi:MAG: DGQHR domain-containing protein [Methylobacterium sp.]|nr:DGQHR domain-containing protein [Methylobacterium sp.]
MSTFSFPFETKALRVDQRIGTFYVAVLPAELLLQVAASDRLRATMNEDGRGYTLEGTQRLVQDKRLGEIAAYINRVDAAFPNTIIVAANYNVETGFDQGEIEYISSEDEGIELRTSLVWTVTEGEDGCHELIIPSSEKLAAIIDGQHRLFAFARAEFDAMSDMNLLCSIFIDLPKALQAQVFATINSTQKRVDRSLTYELFGYNVSDEEEKFWTPDKLAVFFTRKLGTDPESPLFGRIMVAPKRDAVLEQIAAQANWRVSTAVVVDGILRLFSSNPKRDANFMRKVEASPRRELQYSATDRSPLRAFFLECNDALIYKMILNYLKAIDDVFWRDAGADSFIFRAIGVQAIFDVLRKIAERSLESKDIRVEYFTGLLAGARSINFAEERFRNPSGSGRTVIRQAIESTMAIA